MSEQEKDKRALRVIALGAVVLMVIALGARAEVEYRSERAAECAAAQKASYEQGYTSGFADGERHGDCFGE